MSEISAILSICPRPSPFPDTPTGATVLLLPRFSPKRDDFRAERLTSGSTRISLLARAAMCTWHIPTHELGGQPWTTLPEAFTSVSTSTGFPGRSEECTPDSSRPALG